jgi:transposase
MPKACSCDLRERVSEAVETGASRREAAERFEVSVASAVKWLQRWREERERCAKAARWKRFAVGRVRGRGDDFDY